VGEFPAANALKKNLCTGEVILVEERKLTTRVLSD